MKRGGEIADKSKRRTAASAFEERWRTRFQLYAQQHEDDAGIAGWSPTGLQTRLRNFVRIWERDAVIGQWLDAGCGAGTYSRFLQEQGCAVLGLDYSFPSVVKAKGRDSGDSGAWLVADVRHLPVRPASFDGVLCFGVVQALSDARPAVAELTIAVKAGGTVWIDVLNGRCLPHLWERIKCRVRGRAMHLHYESPSRLRRLLKECGLHDVELFWIPIMPMRWQRFQWMLETRLARWVFKYVPMVGALLSHSVLFRGKRSAND